ncbi:MAG TPA: Gfo/Idh/MocA family oxidoreductase [Lacipirellula sp.]
MSTHQLHRRNLLKIAAGIAGPTIVSSRVFGKDAPSNTLQIGCIGTGRMGHGDMGACLTQGLGKSVHARIVAVCDVDRRRAKHARAVVQDFYNRELPDMTHPSVAIYDDFRTLLAQQDIDGVTISTPDHWHGLIAIASAEAGKDIYLQKPLTYTIPEGKRLVHAVRKNRVILQTGSQQRSDANFRKACELVRNGRLGRLRTIRVTVPTDQGVGDATTAQIPSNLDYDMWLGPAPPAKYAEDRVHPQASLTGRPGWLQIEPHCRGMITGWGSHMFDIAQWGHGSDETGPVACKATGDFPHRWLFNVHTTFHASLRYADGVELIAQSGEPAGVVFEGEGSWISVGRGRLEAQHPKILDAPAGLGDAHLYRSENHMLNFLECMRSRRDPVCPVEVGHRSNSICVITHMAMKLGRPLQWDPEAEQFVDDDQANALLNYDYRPPWGL